MSANIVNEAIFKSDNRRFFLKTLSEACEKTGGRVKAWVLMKNPAMVMFSASVNRAAPVRAQDGQLESQAAAGRSAGLREKLERAPPELLRRVRPAAGAEQGSEEPASRRENLQALGPHHSSSAGKKLAGVWRSEETGSAQP